MSLIIVCVLVGDSYPFRSEIQPSKVEYTADVHDKFALCKLKQTFNITIDGVEEAAYQFPVDYNSAFCDLLIRTPREDIRGRVKEKEEAKKMFDQAKREGKQAFLTEESTDRDIYKLSMCNILKGDEITVEYTYITEVEFSDGRNIFYIPNFISPRYGGKFIPFPDHSVYARVQLHNRVSYLKSSMPDTTISFENNVALLEYRSNKVLEKDIEVTYNAEYPLAGLSELPKNLRFSELRYQSRAFKLNVSNHSIVIAQFTPKIEQIPTSECELVFVLDCSGSMSDERIENSRTAISHCLEKMRNTNYVFNIIRYGSTHEMYLPRSVAATNDNIQKAIDYCKNIGADLGGTETYSALKACLDVSKTAILITDGDTSDNDEMHKLCKQFDCLSILGIGSGVNRANIKDMARNGKGIAVFSQTDSNILQNMDKIFYSITTPSVKNPTFEYWHGDHVELGELRSPVQPARIDNSIAVFTRDKVELGEPCSPVQPARINNAVITRNKVTRANPRIADLTNRSPVVSDQLNVVYAIVDDMPQLEKFCVAELNYILDVEPYNGPIDAQYLGCLAAKRIIQENDISEFFTKKSMVDLAVNFNIITKYTSMIAVSSLEVKKPTEEDPQPVGRTGPQGPCGPKGPRGAKCMAMSMNFFGGGSVEESCCIDVMECDASEDEILLMESPQMARSTQSMITSNPCLAMCGIDMNLYNDLTCDPNDTVVSEIYANNSLPQKIGLCDRNLSTTDMGRCPIKSSDDNESSSESSSDDEHVYQESTVLDNTELRKTLEWLSAHPFEVTCDVLKHFDETTGLFNPSVRALFDALPDTLLANEYALTLFVLMCLRRSKGCDDAFLKCYKLAIMNKSVSDLSTKVNFVALVA